MTEAAVTARGHAVVAGRPDESSWTIDLTATADTPDAALAQVGERGQALTALLDEIGLPPEMRSSTGVSVREAVEYENGSPVRRGFRAQNLVTVRLRDPAVAGTLLQGATERAQAQVRGPSWWIAPDNPARIEACRRAAMEAKRKAEAYADALGLDLGAVAEVREPQVTSSPLARASAMTMGAETIDVDPGELEVEADVEVTFRSEVR
jgi:uncharacterized protein YggE